MRIMVSDQCMKGKNKKERPRREARACSVQETPAASKPPAPASAALARALARVLLAAGVRAALQADLLATAGGEGHASGSCRAGSGAASRFGDQFVAHEWLPMYSALI
eukprot:Opistho-2@48677